MRTCLRQMSLAQGHAAGLGFPIDLIILVDSSALSLPLEVFPFPEQDPMDQKPLPLPILSGSALGPCPSPTELRIISSILSTFFISAWFIKWLLMPPYPQGSFPSVRKLSLCVSAACELWGEGEWGMNWSPEHGGQ